MLSPSYNRLQMIQPCAVTLWPGALQAVCQPLLSPVAPIRAPKWWRLWITHLYPLKTSQAGEGGVEAERVQWEAGLGPALTDGFSASACDTDKSCFRSHFQPGVTLSRCSHASYLEVMCCAVAEASEDKVLFALVLRTPLTHCFSIAKGTTLRFGLFM